MVNTFNGRNGCFCGERINLEFYPNPEKNYIFSSLRNNLVFEFEFPLTSHCNLNCQMCTVFSPIATQSFLSIKNYYNDINRIHELFGTKNIWFRMVGGEPLLHPEINEMMILSRKILPEALISITTNGILLNNMNDEFYKIAERKNIVILISPYPPIDTDFLISCMRSKGILAFRTVKKFTSRKSSLDISGSNNAVENFKRCGYRCNFILNGNLSRCFYPLVIHHFNKYFGQRLIVSKNDFINIHYNGQDEINRFLNSPISFCRYCKNDKIEYFPWKKSENKISEWI